MTSKDSLIDMSLDDIIKLNRKKNRTEQNKKGNSKKRKDVKNRRQQPKRRPVNKIQQFRSRFQNQGTKPKPVGQNQANTNALSRSLSRSQRRSILRRKRSGVKPKQQFAARSLLQAKRTLLRNQQQQRQQSARQTIQFQRRGIMVTQSTSNHLPRLDHDDFPYGPMRSDEILFNAKYRDQRSWERTTLNSPHTDMLTVSINNNLAGKTRSLSPLPPRSQVVNRSDVKIAYPLLSSNKPKPKGIKGLKAPVSQTSKTLNERFTQNAQNRFVFQ